MAIMTLRSRVALAFCTGFLAVLVLALMTYLSLSFSSQQADALQNSSEKLSLTREAAEDGKAAITALRIDMAQKRRLFYTFLAGITIATLLLTSVVFLWVFRSVTSPLNTLAAVFQRLAEGSEEAIAKHAISPDEIGELYDAAEAFRLENIRERQLSNDYRRLTENLELEVDKRTRQLKARNAELDHLASIDKLTGVFNRRSLDRSLAEEIARAQRYKRPLAVLLIDIDFFKKINDQHGHLAGDCILISATEALRNNIRASDILGRWGGEEFLVICPETAIEQAHNAAEKIRAAMELGEFPVANDITISVGVAGYAAGDTLEALVDFADKALYRAKESGRNQVCVSPLPKVRNLNAAQKFRY